MEIQKIIFLRRRTSLLGFLSIALGIWSSGCVSFPSGSSSSSRGDLLLPEVETEKSPARGDFAEAMAHFSLALGHEFRGEGDEALRQYHLAIDKDPGNETLHLLASRRLVQQKRVAEAIALMERLLEQDPLNERALLWTSQLQLQSGNEAGSLDLLLKVVDAGTAAEAPYLEAARLLLRQQRTEEALATVRKGIDHAENRQRLFQLGAELLIRQAAADVDQEEVKRAEAAGILRAAREQYPKHLPFRILAASLAIADGDMATAMDMYREADAQAAGNLDVRNALLVHLVRTLGGPNQAETSLRRHLQSMPDDALAHFFRGLIAELGNRGSVALSSYRMAAELNPGDIQAFRKLASLYLASGETEEAVAILTTGLEHHAGQAALYELLGGIQLSLEEYEEAVSVYRKLDELRRRGAELEDELRFRILYAISLIATGHALEAVEPLTVAAREDRSLIAVFWQSQMRRAFEAEEGSPLRLAREEDLLKALRELSNRLPEEPEVLRFLGRTFLFRRDYTQALPALEEAKQIAETLENPEIWVTADLLFDLASALERSGKIDQAVEVFEQVIQLEPDHAPALNYLAYMWAERAVNLEKALDYVQRALRDDPDNGAYIDTRGWVYFQLGRFEEAYRDLRRASEIEPEESVIAEHVGDVLMKLDRPVEARGYYKIALVLGPEDREEIILASLERAEQAVADLFRPEAVPAVPESGSTGP